MCPVLAHQPTQAAHRLGADGHDADAFRAAMSGNKARERLDIVRSLAFRQDITVGTRGNRGGHVVFGLSSGQAIDAHEALHGSRRDQETCRFGPSGGLAGRRHGILKIENQGIRPALHGPRQFAGAVCRNEQVGAAGHD